MSFVGGPNTCITNARWRTAAIYGQIEKSPYLSNGLTDCHEAWHGDILDLSDLSSFGLLKIQDGGDV